MAVKFNEYWNIVPSTLPEYVDFMQGYHIPTMNKIGINIVTLWSVFVGAGPQVICEGLAKDFSQIENALRCKEFTETNTKLLSFVTDYRSKVLVPTTRLTNLPRLNHKGTVKFSQYWDIIPGNEKEYDRFIREVHYPSMEDIGIHIVGEWKVLIGESPNVYYEGRADNVEHLLRSLENEKFKIIKSNLLKLVTNYSSRINNYHAFYDKNTKSYEFLHI